MERVLLLNAGYEPLALLPLRRAVKLVLKERAEPASRDNLLLASPGLTMLIPRVLRLRFYVYAPQALPPVWTRRGVLVRDRYTCAYCGKRCSPREATIDHIVPVSRGGLSSWRNTVVACYACNQAKADRTPAEAGMKLLFEPQPPDAGRWTGDRCASLSLPRLSYPSGMALPTRCATSWNTWPGASTSA